MKLNLVLMLCTILMDNTLSSTTCDCSSSCSSSTITDDMIYCNSQESCSSADLEPTTSLQCLGNEACENANIVSNGADWGIYCFGYEGCLSADIYLKNTTNQDHLYCSGYQACKSATITNQGVQAGVWTGNRIQCRGDYGCLFASITTDSSIYCVGHYACKGATITSTNGQSDAFTKIFCHGTYGCHGININSASAMFCWGYSSCFATNIANVGIVLGFGYSALRDSSIDSQGLSDLDVRLTGYLAGNNLQIICRDGVDCVITCDGYGCQNTEIIYCDHNDVTLTEINPNIDISVACTLPRFQNTYYENTVWCPTLTKDCSPSTKKIAIKEEKQDDEAAVFTQNIASVELVKSVQSVYSDTFKGILIGVCVGWVTAMLMWCFANKKNKNVGYESLQ